MRRLLIDYAIKCQNIVCLPNFVCSVQAIIKRFSCSARAEHEIYDAHNVKIPTIVGSLTFISIINTAESLKARIKSLYFSVL